MPAPRPPLAATLSFAAALAPAVAFAVPTPARADDANAFLADTRRFATMKSFRVELDSTSPTTGTTAETLTFVAPDKLRIEMPARNFVAVVIGQYVWLRGPSHTWKRVQMAPGADPFAAVHDTNAIAERVRGRTIRLLGTQTLDGAPMHVYEIDAPPRPGYSAKTERVWIGALDGYPHKIVQRNGPFASTATYSSFNRLFSISVTQ
jgi:outer membrane lipoprotein-sorting protein